jgi:hypothetical protein
MADRYIRIGAVEDGWGYDDADFPNASIETDGRIKAGTAPIAGDDVLRLDDVYPGIADVITARAYFFARIY